LCEIYRFKNSYLFFHFTGELEDEKGSESKQDEEVFEILLLKFINNNVDFRWM